jgi:hypothetical protein
LTPYRTSDGPCPGVATPGGSLRGTSMRGAGSGGSFTGGSAVAGLADVDVVGPFFDEYPAR